MIARPEIEVLPSRSGVQYALQEGAPGTEYVKDRKAGLREGPRFRRRDRAMNLNETGSAIQRITAGVRPAPPAPPADAGRFASALNAADGRSGEIPATIPPAVIADVRRAGALADALADRGQQVRFSTHELTGRVVAHLCDLDGNPQREVPLTELIADPRSL